MAIEEMKVPIWLAEIGEGFPDRGDRAYTE